MTNREAFATALRLATLDARLARGDALITRPYPAPGGALFCEDTNRVGRGAHRSRNGRRHGGADEQSERYYQRS